VNASVIGAGAWGSAFARHLGTLGVPTRLWVREQELMAALETRGENTLFLPGFRFPSAVEFSNDLRGTASFGEVIFIAVPSRFCRDVYCKIAPALRGTQIVVSLTKGFDPRSLACMSQVMQEAFRSRNEPRLAVLSGPSFAREVAEGRPTAVVVASRSPAAARTVQRLVSGPELLVYTSRDVIGVEVAGAVKNVIAIAAGISDALGLGANARAALITRGLAEIRRLGVALGARGTTFSGLAGLGDLLLTCTGELSRNHRVGCELGLGRSLDEITGGMKMVAEGVQTTRTVRRLARAHGVAMPISEEVYRVMYRGKAAARAVADLMARRPGAE
jgi:glycerol-3-phosphate dehydrogenase (NAD(P)+)